MVNQLTALDSTFHALSDATRRAVVARLTEGEATVTTLAEPFEMGLPAFLKHLRVLEGAGLIETEKAGRVRTCRLRPDPLAETEAWFTQLRAAWQGRYGQLDDLLATLDDPNDT